MSTEIALALPYEKSEAQKQKYRQLLVYFGIAVCILGVYVIGVA